jgi:uncharacterized RDD family membrane protein YckC
MKHEISLGRRLLGLTIDWLMCYAIALGFFSGSGSFIERASNARTPLTLLLFAEYLLLIVLSGASFGHRIVRLKVVRFSDGGAPTPIQALIRTVLMMLVVTAITYDDNGRGIHERLSGTKLVDLRKKSA